jgi:hypothetical protein
MSYNFFHPIQIEWPSLSLTCISSLAAVIVNAETFIWGCEFDINTDFTGMDIDLARIDLRLRESLKTRVSLLQ